jgi:NAD(P)-dependent dehydrogenase (short-subunit alcohol dehydrogenase family)
LVAVVTGGNGGLGLALARGVGRAGARVCIWARNPNKNRQAAEGLRAEGIECQPVLCDVADESAVASAMAETLAHFGRVDSLFANAGVAGSEVSFADLTLEEWRSVMSIDVDGAFLCLREAARHMLSRDGGGSLVGVSSIASRFGVPRKAHYGAAKPALEGIIRSIAVELAGAGIRCNSLSPGWTDTEMTGANGGFGTAHHDAFKAATIKRTPLRRWAGPDDLAEVASFLADPRLVFHTGDNMVVDGGYSIS